MMPEKDMEVQQSIAIRIRKANKAKWILLSSFCWTVAWEMQFLLKYFSWKFLVLVFVAGTTLL